MKKQKVDKASTNLSFLASVSHLPTDPALSRPALYSGSRSAFPGFPVGLLLARVLPGRDLFARLRFRCSMRANTLFRSPDLIRFREAFLADLPSASQDLVHNHHIISWDKKSSIIFSFLDELPDSGVASSSIYVSCLLEASQFYGDV